MDKAFLDNVRSFWARQCRLAWLNTGLDDLTMVSTPRWLFDATLAQVMANEAAGRAARRILGMLNAIRPESNAQEVEEVLVAIDQADEAVRKTWRLWNVQRPPLGVFSR